MSVDTLAIHGGTPAVQAAETAPPPRWDDRERAQLAEMCGQTSLFYWNGPQTRLLIQRFQEHYPLPHVFPCSSGTAALHVALLACGLKPGEEVIVPPITDMGTVTGILYQLGVPVFADLLPDSYTLDPEDVERKITPKTRAIIAVHLAGNPCDLDRLLAVARRHQLVLIEDCAQAWGARYRGRPVGTLGDFGCYSLNDFKHISCGDGGIVACNDPAYGARLQRCGDKAYPRDGSARRPQFLAPNYRISEPQSAVAAVQLTKMEAITAATARLGRQFVDELKDVPGVQLPAVRPEDHCSFWFILFRPDPARLSCTREQFVAALNAEGVKAGAGYIEAPLYRYPVFAEHNFFGGSWPVRDAGLTTMDYTRVCCPVAEAVLATAVVLRLPWSQNEDWVRQAARAVRKVAAYYAK